MFDVPDWGMAYGFDKKPHILSKKLSNSFNSNNSSDSSMIFSNPKLESDLVSVKKKKKQKKCKNKFRNLIENHSHNISEDNYLLTDKKNSDNSTPIFKSKLNKISNKRTLDDLKILSNDNTYPKNKRFKFEKVNNDDKFIEKSKIIKDKFTQIKVSNILNNPNSVVISEKPDILLKNKNIKSITQSINNKKIKKNTISDSKIINNLPHPLLQNEIFTKSHNTISSNKNASTSLNTVEKPKASNNKKTEILNNSQTLKLKLLKSNANIFNSILEKKSLNTYPSIPVLNKEKLSNKLANELKANINPTNKKHKKSLRKSKKNEYDLKTSQPTSDLKKELHNSLIDITSNKNKKNKDGLSLRERMLAQLSSARFRYVNEQLYNIDSQGAMDMFSKDRKTFEVYHEGYSNQVDKWPVNPVNLMIQYIKSRSTNLVVADFGCGNAKIARSVKNKTVYSFDLVDLNEYVIVCDIKKVPIISESVDIAVFCLSLMGTNLVEYLCEANRVLKVNGSLLIAEVQSRFEKIGSFIRKLDKLGFSLEKKDISNKMFVWFEFKKSDKKLPGKNFLPTIELNPCTYKKR